MKVYTKCERTFYAKCESIHPVLMVRSIELLREAEKIKERWVRATVPQSAVEVLDAVVTCREVRIFMKMCAWSSHLESTLQGKRKKQTETRMEWQELEQSMGVLFVETPHRPHPRVSRICGCHCRDDFGR